MLQNKRISLSDYNNIIAWAIEYGMLFTIIEGVLLDSVVIDTNKQRLIKGGRKTRYIMIIDEFANSNSSTLRLVFTDSEKKVRDFIKNRTSNVAEYHEKIDLIGLY